MGKILLCLMIAVEMGFLVWNMTTSTIHKKEKRITSVVLFALFVILTILRIIQWSFRYYLFALILLIQVITAGFGWIRKNNMPKSVKKVRCVVKSVFACLGYLLILIPALVFPQYKAIVVTGHDTVENTLVTYTDKNRRETYDDSGAYREVNVRIWYPKEKTKGCPLVVFSHGFNGINLTNISLFEELASNGYVVCSMDHPYQSYFTRDTNGKITTISERYQKQFNDDLQTEDKKKVYEDVKEWMGIREGDINFVLDTILKKSMETDADAWYHKINTEKIAVCGHSMGGAAALGIGRHRDGVSAVIAMESPYMSDITGVDEQKNKFIWEEASYPVPVLNIYSDCTWGKFDQSPLYDENERALRQDDGEVKNVHIKGAGHLELTDLSLVSPFLTHRMDPSSKQKDTHHVLERINQESLQFLNYYLKGEGKKPDMH